MNTPRIDAALFKAGESVANEARAIEAENEKLRIALKAIIAGLTQPCQSTEIDSANEAKMVALVNILRGDAKFAVNTAATALNS